ncbi:MAG TPA: branched-chain amino acid ABC transporter permease [Acidimicrobiales bacterium]|nr:branched-chain amino acid ABC transporter permease [Acidimicrobiales bacterium]
MTSPGPVATPVTELGPPAGPGARLGRGAALALAGLVAVLAVLTSGAGPAGAGAEAAGGAPPRQAEEERLGTMGGRVFVEEGAEDRPVAGVTLVVRRGSTVVTEETTDAEGQWEAEVPVGTYTVTLDQETLPDGVDLRDEDRGTLGPERVGPNLRRTFAFPLGERVIGPSFADRFGDRLGAGVRVGLIVGMAAIGLSLVFGVTGLVNFAHGELVTFGALVVYFLSSARGGVPQLSLVVASVLTVACGLLLGAALEGGVFGPLRRRGTGNVALIVFTIGMSLLLRYTYLVVFDNNPRPLRQYATQRAVFLGLAPKDLVVCAVAVVAMVGVGLLLQGTRLGTAMRAVADDRDLAESSGIDVRRIILAVWAVGTGLAALGGVLFAVAEQVDWDLGYQQLLLMFAAVVLGGLGSAYGAMVGGMIVGLASEVSTLWIPNDFKTAVSLGVLVVVLLLRPQGVLGVRERLG